MAFDFRRFTQPIKGSLASENNMTVILLGADVEPRRKSYGPKSLLTLDNKYNVIEHQIDAVKNVFPKADIILVAGFQAQSVVNKGYPIRIVENPFFEETSDVEQIRLGINASVSRKVLIVSGDLVFDAHSIHGIDTHGSCILYKECINDDESLGITQNRDVLEHITYKLPNKWLYNLYLEEKELICLKKFLKTKERSKLLFFEAVNYLVDSGSILKAIPNIHGIMHKVN